VRKLWSIVRRELTRVGDRRKRNKHERDRANRRRRRIQDWEESSKREPGRGVARRAARQLGDDRRGCAFCTATRSWFVARWAQVVDAASAMRSYIATFVERVGRLLTSRRADEASHASRGVLRRRPYPGSRPRRFELHVPRGYTEGSAVPLLMVLHGCRQNTADIRSISNFDAIADREGFVVVYPFVTSYSGVRMRNCWGWWLDSEIRPGAGEVEDVWQIVEQIKGELNIDARRIHVAGLSSGGGMAVAAMVAHHDKFASGAAAAGVPYSETPRAVSYGGPSGVAFRPTEQVVRTMKSVMGAEGRPSPILIVHSVDDPVVDIGAARNLRDSWTACYEIDSTRPGSEESGVDGETSWVHSKYRESRKRSAVETLFIEGAGHGWYGGNPGRFSYPAAPDTSSLMWQFFKRHPLYSDTRRGSGRIQIREAS